MDRRVWAVGACLAGAAPASRLYTVCEEQPGFEQAHTYSGLISTALDGEQLAHPVWSKRNGMSDRLGVGA